MIGRRMKSIFCAALLGASALSGQAVAKPSPAASSAQAQRPNIVLIYADDMGRGDLSVYGNKLIQTTNIDRLASEGTRFSNAYVTAPLCSPSRAGLITGRYQQRFGFEYQVASGPSSTQRNVKQPDGSYVQQARDISADGERGVPVSEANLAEILRPAGYATGVIGKWHLGHEDKFQPQNRGFDYSFIFDGNTSVQNKDLDDPNFVAANRDNKELWWIWSRDGDLMSIHENGKPVDVDGYLLERFQKQAIDFIDRNKAKPFFLYLPFNAPVVPVQMPKSYHDKLSGIADPVKRAYEAHMLAYDDIVGGVLDHLKRAGLDKNTIVIFSSDNGAWNQFGGSNAPFAGGKFNTYEGGIRTPLIIKWPGHLKGGATYDQPTSTLDLLPTLTQAAHAPLPAGKQIDGVDLVPYLDGTKAGVPHDVLYWKLGNFAAVRQGKWKLFIDTAKNIEALYDLDADEGETTDLASRQPGKLAELKRLYAGWQGSLPAPTWTSW